MTKERKEQLLAFLNRGEDAFSSYNHIRLVDLDDGMARVELDLQPESLNIWNVPHGGVIFTLADVATGTAALAARMESCLTVQANVDFIAAAAPTGRLTCVGRVLRSGRKVCFCEAEITDEREELLAQVSTVLCYTGQKIEV